MKYRVTEANWGRGTGHVANRTADEREPAPGVNLGADYCLEAGSAAFGGLAERSARAVQSDLIIHIIYYITLHAPQVVFEQIFHAGGCIPVLLRR